MTAKSYRLPYNEIYHCTVLQYHYAVIHLVPVTVLLYHTMQRSFSSVLSNGLAVLLLCILSFQVAESILPTGAIDVKCQDGSGCDYTLLASQASFGEWPAMKAENNEPMVPFLPPSDDPLLCLGTSTSIQQQQQSSPNFIIVSPRGQCTFEQKAFHAQKLGASGLIIYGTLASRYSLNETTIQEGNPTAADIIYPLEFHDYDCSNSRAEIPIAALSYDQYPYDSSRNDPILSGPSAKGNLCAYQNDYFEESCPSMRCLLTGNINDDHTAMEACCAWDLHIWLYKDANMTISGNTDDAKGLGGDPVTIPTFYITMAEADTLLNNLQMNQISVTMYRRYAPEYNVSSIIIWALGVFVAATAAWMSSGEYRYATKYELLNQSSETDRDTRALSQNGTHEYEKVANNNSSGALLPPDESLELGAAHAIGFIVFSAGGLLILFYFKIYSVVKCLYAFGCSGAIFQVIFYPLFHRLAMKMNFRDKVAFTTDVLEVGSVSYVQLVAMVVSYGLGGVWMYISFTRHHPDSILFFWVMQGKFNMICMKHCWKPNKNVILTLVMLVHCATLFRHYGSMHVHYVSFDDESEFNPSCGGTFNCSLLL